MSQQLPTTQDPFLDRRHALDREQFKPVQDEFYALHGWDVERAWPTEERLRPLGMEEVFGPMLEGANRSSLRNGSGSTGEQEE